MTKFQLFSLLAMNGTAHVQIKGVRGILQGIERESGDGRCFNLSIRLCDGQFVRVFVRTID